MEMVEDYMTPDPLIVDPTTSLREVVELMRDRGIGAVLVRGGSGRLDGIFTERDLLTKLDFQEPQGLADLPVERVMSRDLLTVPPWTRYLSALRLMRLRRIRHLPVVREGRVIGMLSIRDVLLQADTHLHHTFGRAIRLQARKKALEADVESLRALASDREKAFRRLQEDQRQIVQMEKMATLGTLAAGFAHEIKNPLAIIVQGLEQMERLCDGQVGPEPHRYLRIVRRAADRAEKIVTALLRYSRSSAMERKVVDLGAVLDAAVEMVGANPIFSRVRFHKEYAPLSKRIVGDPLMLQQVFVDLFLNAAQAMPEGGDIVLSLIPSSGDPEGDQLTVRVRDTGTGIPAEHLDRIFEPFFTTKEEGEGTGLGLSTVYLIVERHGGRIDVESRVGGGTTFIITWPAVGPQASEEGSNHGE